MADWKGQRDREVGMETGPMALGFWNERTSRGLPFMRKARHAHAALSTIPNETDRYDAAGLVQIVRTGL